MVDVKKPGIGGATIFGIVLIILGLILAIIGFFVKGTFRWVLIIGGLLILIVGIILIIVGIRGRSKKMREYEKLIATKTTTTTTTVKPVGATTPTTVSQTTATVATPTAVSNYPQGYPQQMYQPGLVYAQQPMQGMYQNPYGVTPISPEVLTVTTS